VTAVIEAGLQRIAMPNGGECADLYEHLVGEHGYLGSYKSVVRYVRSHYPPEDPHVPACGDPRGPDPDGLGGIPRVDG
jgi:hypothetical protein